jgi:hypothetical protein
MLPDDLLRAYGDRWSPLQKMQIYSEILSQQKNQPKDPLGDPEMDAPGWLKLQHFCSTSI